MIVCTSICANYIPKAKVLAESLKRHNPAAIMAVCLVEKTVHPAANDPLFDHVITADSLNIKAFDSFIFRHSIVEASTAVKAHLFKELMQRFPEENEFIYLDPDILVLGTFTELSEALKKHDIVLTPHLSEPEEDFVAVMDNEVCALKHGVFNLGFLAVRRSKEAERLIDWWAERLYDLCYADIASGLFTDQRWMDLAPCFFDVFVFRHPGYNIAPWNLSRRKITEAQGGYLANGHHLRFFHFSGFDSGANEGMVKKYCPDPKDPVFAIRDGYIKKLDGFGQKEIGDLPWSYDFYDNSERVKREHRVVYRASKELQGRFPLPFQAGASSSYYEYVKSYTGALKGWQSLKSRSTELAKNTRLAFNEGGVRLVFERALKLLGRK